MLTDKVLEFYGELREEVLEYVNNQQEEETPVEPSDKTVVFVTYILDTITVLLKSY